MRLQINNCLRIQLGKKTGKQTVLLCASPLVENANWWDLNFVQSSPKASLSKSCRKTSTGKQTVLACAGPWVENANWWDLNFVQSNPKSSSSSSSSSCSCSSSSSTSTSTSTSTSSSEYKQLANLATFLNQIPNQLGHYWQTNGPCMRRPTGKECKLSNLEIFPNQIPNHFCQNAIGE